jgi:hypothetical protein
LTLLPCWRATFLSDGPLDMQNVLAGVAFLVIGDSHFSRDNYLITTLHNELLQRGAQVETFGACGLTAGDWIESSFTPCGTAHRGGDGPVEEYRTGAKSWAIDALIDRVKPKVVVVGIGDTMAAYGRRDIPRQWISENVKALTSRITAHHVSCIWVGPAWGTEGGPYFKTFARAKEMSDFLATQVSPCVYVDSLALATPGEWPTFDGMHFTTFGYRQWGAALATAIAQPTSEKKAEHWYQPAR